MFTTMETQKQPEPEFIPSIQNAILNIINLTTRSNQRLIRHQATTTKTAREKDAMHPFHPFRVQSAIWLFVFRFKTP